MVFIMNTIATCAETVTEGFAADQAGVKTVAEGETLKKENSYDKKN